MRWDSLDNDAFFDRLDVTSSHLRAKEATGSGSSPSFASAVSGALPSLTSDESIVLVSLQPRLPKEVIDAQLAAAAKAAEEAGAIPLSPLREDEEKVSDEAKARPESDKSHDAE